MLWLSGNSNHDYRQQSKHQRREELGQPVRSSFVSNSNSNSNSINKGNVNNDNHVVRSVNRGGTYFNSDDDKSGNINDLSQKIEGVIPVVAVRCQYICSKAFLNSVEI